MPTPKPLSAACAAFFLALPCVMAFPAAAVSAPMEDVLKWARDDLAAQDVTRESIVDQLEFGKPWGLDCFPGMPFQESGFDPDRSLIVHDFATLHAADFSLTAVLSQFAAQVAPSVPGVSAVSIFRQMFASQRARLPADPATQPHCSDAGQTLNGFPYPCRVFAGNVSIGADSGIANIMAGYAPMALVNRIDLAHSGWRNCGEYRIVYNTVGNGIVDDLIIFEGVLPNPRPGCARSCSPVADFWAGLSFESDPAARAGELHRFFFEGLDGFRPVVHVDHYSARGVSGYGGSGSGQIRSNSVIEVPWDLREFKTALDCSLGPCVFNILPIPVRNTAGPGLWKQETAEAGGVLGGIAQRFQASVIAQAPALARASVRDMAFTVAGEAASGHNWGQREFSPPGTFAEYWREYDPDGPGGGPFPFRDRLRAVAEDLGVTEENLVKRAQGFSCGGCHTPFSYDLDTGIDALRQDGTFRAGWPLATFKHIGQQPSASDGPGTVYGLSNAMRDEYLPVRREFLLDFLEAELCPCRHGFIGMASAADARKLESSVSAPFMKVEAGIAKEIATLSQGRPGPKILKQILALRGKLDQVDREREKAVVTALASKGLSPGPDNASLSATPFLKRIRAWDALKAEVRSDSLSRRLVQAAYQEPVRRTVTGAMPTH